MSQHILRIPQVAVPREDALLPIIPPLVVPLQPEEGALLLVGRHEENLTAVEALRGLEEGLHCTPHGEAKYLPLSRHALRPVYYLEEQSLRWQHLVVERQQLLDVLQLVLRAVVAHRLAASTCVGALPPLAAASRVCACAGVHLRVRHRWSPRARRRRLLRLH